MDIREVDPHDQAQVRRFWEVGKAAEDAHRQYDFYWPWESAWAIFSGGRSDTETVLLGAFDGETMWGAAQVDHPLHDNTHLAYAEFFVHPERQREGIGSALVARGCEVARAHGRRVLVVEAYAPPDVDSAALAFARALGFSPAIEEGMKVVDLPATEDRWSALAQAAAPHHRDYRLVVWHDEVPDEYVEGYCRMNEAFNVEAPMGDLDVEAERWDEARVRDREQRARRAYRFTIGTLAVSGDDDVVGMTEAIVLQKAPWRGMQGGTLVLPDHRGHRLGMAMKVANQQAIRARFPECQILLTGNAGSNAHMNAVNDQLGYRLVERCVEVQRQL